MVIDIIYSENEILSTEQCPELDIPIVESLEFRIGDLFMISDSGPGT